MNARRSADGQYRLSWSDSLNVINLARVTASDTGEPLHVHRGRAALLGGLAGGLAGGTIILSYWLWSYVLDRSYGSVLVLITLGALLLIWLGSALMASRFLTFMIGVPWQHSRTMQTHGASDA